MEGPPVAKIRTREPVIDNEFEEQYKPEKMDQQWRLLTEAVLRDILTKPEIRKLVASYIKTPVSESLPKQFLDGLSSDERVRRLKERYKSQIGAYLDLEPVPENQITPDLRLAQSLSKPADIVRMLQRIYGTDTAEYYRQLEAKSSMLLRGITAQERVMIAQRYRFARDVKLLALQAEASGIRENIQANDSNEAVLPSGTCIRINIEDETKRRELLNPQNWKKRRQLKDRVYEIEVGSSSYILKEKKTARHTDTMGHGHRPGLSSLKEFQTARQLRENGIVNHGNIKVNWEKPVATVTFPDGFQFTVFAHEEGLIEEETITQLLAEEILEHRKQYQQEFNAIRAITAKFKDDPRVLLFEHGNTRSGLKAILQWMGLRKKQISELTFEEFALIKALRMVRQAKNLMQETITKNGYIDIDSEDHAYKINSVEGKPQLEIFGFDFEYFSPIDQSEVERTIRRLKDYVQKRESQFGIGFLYWDDGSPVTRMQRACYFAILQSENCLQQE